MSLLVLHPIKTEILSCPELFPVKGDGEQLTQIVRRQRFCKQLLVWQVKLSVFYYLIDAHGDGVMLLGKLLFPEMQHTRHMRIEILEHIVHTNDIVHAVSRIEATNALHA